MLRVAMPRTPHHTTSGFTSRSHAGRSGPVRNVTRDLSLRQPVSCLRKQFHLMSSHLHGLATFFFTGLFRLREGDAATSRLRVLLRRLAVPS